MSNQNQSGPRPTLTVDLTEAARVAERLAENLRRITTDDAGWAAGALNDIGRLAELKADLAELYRQYLADQIPTAVGNAATHEWRVSDGGADLVCGRCDSSAVPRSLRDGQTPTCPDRCQAFSSPVGHSLYPAYDADSSHCIYCKTVYPATASTREAVTVNRRGPQKTDTFTRQGATPRP